MKNILKTIICLPLLAACGAPDDSFELVKFEWSEARIDGHPQLDGIFVDQAERDAFCEAAPDHDMCSDLGTLQQEAWASAEYHGQGINLGSGVSESCYSPGIPAAKKNGNCAFPSLKQMKLVFQTGNCYDTPDSSSDPVPSLLQVNKMIAELKNGAKFWTGPGNVTVEDNTCSHSFGCMTVTLSCQKNLKTANGVPALGIGTFVPTETRISDLPVGPHGENQKQARVYTTGSIRFDILALWKRMKTTCSESGTSADISQYYQYLGQHEMGHAFGFDHFGIGPMSPAQPCNPTGLIPNEMRTALEIFNSGSGSATVSDHNLETYSP